MLRVAVIQQASQDLDSKKKDQIRRWFDGPSFLWNRKQCWLEKSQLEEVSDEDPEVRKVFKVNVSNIQNSSVLSRLQEITSSWIKMKRITALIMVIKRNWSNRLGKVSSLNELNNSIDTEMIQKAEIKSSFWHKLNHLPMKSSNWNQKRKWFQKAVLFWITEASYRLVGDWENHLVIFPEKCPVSNMIVQWSHHSAAHWARGITLNLLRQTGIWIVNANAIVWYLIHKCIVCSKLHWKM